MWSSGTFYPSVQTWCSRISLCDWMSQRCQPFQNTNFIVQQIKTPLVGTHILHTWALLYLWGLLSFQTRAHTHIHTDTQSLAGSSSFLPKNHLQLQRYGQGEGLSHALKSTHLPAARDSYTNGFWEISSFLFLKIQKLQSVPMLCFSLCLADWIAISLKNLRIQWCLGSNHNLLPISE